MGRPEAIPEVRYALSGDVHIAYQVWGKGPINIVATPGDISHLDYFWKDAGARKYFEALGEFARVALFDKRGTGLSDRERGVPTFEQRMDDIRAVMDAAQFNDAVVLGHSEGVAMSVLFAASFPNRSKGLILYGGNAKGTWAPDYPWASTREEFEQEIYMDEHKWMTEEWKEYRIKSYATYAPMNDKEFLDWELEMTRMGASPGASVALSRSYMAMDVRSILPSIHVPTLVLHRVGDRIERGRYLASHIPGAKLVELPGTYHWFATEPEMIDRVIHEIRQFVLDLGTHTSIDRVLKTVLFTDIAESTKKATELGDSNWHNLLQKHNAMARGEISKFGGSVVKSTGDGFLAIFDGPTRAIRCASAITNAARQLGIEVRTGLHTGECIVGPDDVSGIAVHLASRILDEASPGEVIVSATVKDLVYGSGISFKDRGERELKGVDDKKKLFSVEAVG